MATPTNTLQSGAWLLKQIEEGGRWKKEDLTHHQRCLIVQFMLYEGKWTKTEIGDKIGVHRNSVHDISKKLKKHAARALDDLDQRAVAVELISTAEVVCARLMRNGKDAEAWKVKKELIEALQTLGFISKEPIRVDANLRLSLREVLELAAGNHAADRAAEIQNGFHENGTHPSLPDASGA